MTDIERTNVDAAMACIRAALSSVYNPVKAVRILRKAMFHLRLITRATDGD